MPLARRRQAVLHMVTTEAPYMPDIPKLEAYFATQGNMTKHQREHVVQFVTEVFATKSASTIARVPGERARGRRALTVPMMHITPLWPNRHVCSACTRPVPPPKR